MDSSFNEGTPVYATCKATGKPDPDVAWIHNGQIQISGPKTVHLNFSVISKSDAGMYTCRANNSVGRTEEHVNLLINCKCSRRLRIVLGAIRLALIIEWPPKYKYSTTRNNMLRRFSG